MADAQESQFAALRREMVEQIALHAAYVSEETGVESLAARVMEAMASVPRHEFVPPEMRVFAYFDQPLPIGFGKTISQPFIVALMTELLDTQPSDRVLEVGTGLGYQAAVLARLVQSVYTVEIIEELARGAERRLQESGCSNVRLRTGNGSAGWGDEGPFDKVLVAAAPELIPPPLLHQLKPGGRMVIPAGLEDSQQLLLVEKDREGHTTTREVLRVRFAPLVTAH